MGMARKQRREIWGTYLRQDGTPVVMVRGPRNRTWFEDANGERVPGIEESNICQAHCHAGSLGWSHVSTSER